MMSIHYDGMSMHYGDMLPLPVKIITVRRRRKREEQEDMLSRPVKVVKVRRRVYFQPKAWSQVDTERDRAMEEEEEEEEEFRRKLFGK